MKKLFFVLIFVLLLSGCNLHKEKTQVKPNFSTWVWNSTDNFEVSSGISQQEMKEVNEIINEVLK